MSAPCAPGIFEKPVSAELARVLAQAADTPFHSSQFYVVARYSQMSGASMNPYDVHPPFATCEDAQQLVEKLGPEYGVFGPFVDTHHPPPLDQETVAKLEVTPQRGSEPQPPFTIDGQKYDALFYSIEAVEKFVLPYLTAEYGSEFATYVSKQFSQASLALLGHLPWSEEILVKPPSGSASQDAVTGAGAHTRMRHVPVVFYRDNSGEVKSKPLYPPPPHHK